MTQFDVTAFGETMLRLSVPPGQPLETTAQLDVHAAGSESNVLASLARLGRSCSWVSALPESALGRIVANRLRMHGVDLSGVVWEEFGRIGTFFVEIAAPPHPTQVIYDRANASITQLTPDRINWDSLLNTRLLHLTGITPALSPNCHAIVIEAIERANAANVPISFDINYRGKLWAPAAAADCLRPLLQNAALLFCAKRDADLLFGLTGSTEDVISQLAAQTKAQHIILSDGAMGVTGWDGTSYFHQPAYETTIIDPLGAGDAMAAGIIDGWLANNLRRGLQIGAQLAATALSQKGDIPIAPPAALNQLPESGQRSVQR